LAPTSYNVYNHTNNSIRSRLRRFHNVRQSAPKKLKALELAVSLLKKQFGTRFDHAPGRRTFHLVPATDVVPTGSIGFGPGIGNWRATSRKNHRNIWPLNLQVKRHSHCMLLPNVKEKAEFVAFVDAEHAIDVGLMLERWV